MSKEYNIKWTRSDYSRLSHTIRKFNEKVSWVEWNNPDISDLQPDKLDYQSVKAEIKTRKDLNRFLSKHKRYLKEGAENVETSSRGAHATKWEVENFKIAQRTENARRTRERKKIEQEEVKIGGKGTGQTRAQMGSIKDNSLKNSKKDFKIMSQKEWVIASKMFDKLLDKKYIEERKEIMRENYLKGLLENNFLDAVPELEDYIRGVDLDTFFKTQETDETATFLFYKDPAGWDVRKDKIVSSWKTAFEEYKAREGNEAS